jgi:hypothetical protein
MPSQVLATAFLETQILRGCEDQSPGGMGAIALNYAKQANLWSGSCI